MNAKEYLLQAFHLMQMIEADRMELDQFRILIASIMPVIKNNKPLLAKIQTFENHIECAIDSYRDLMTKVENSIFELTNDKHRQLLYKRYIEHKTWDAIADEMYCTFQNCHQLHKRALAHLAILKGGNEF